MLSTKVFYPRHHSCLEGNDAVLDEGVYYRPKDTYTYFVRQSGVYHNDRLRNVRSVRRGSMRSQWGHYDSDRWKHITVEWRIQVDIGPDSQKESFDQYSSSSTPVSVPHFLSCVTLSSNTVSLDFTDNTLDEYIRSGWVWTREYMVQVNYYLTRVRTREPFHSNTALRNP